MIFFIKSNFYFIIAASQEGENAPNGDLDLYSDDEDDDNWADIYERKQGRGRASEAAGGRFQFSR